MPSVTLHRLWSTLLTRQCKAVWQHLIFLASSNKYSQWSTYGFLPGKNVWRPSKSAWNSPIHPNFCVIHIIYSPSFQWMGAMCRMCQLRGPFLCEAFLGCSLVRALTVIEILFNNSTYWTILMSSVFLSVSPAGFDACILESLPPGIVFNSSETISFYWLDHFETILPYSEELAI